MMQDTETAQPVDRATGVVASVGDLAVVAAYALAAGYVIVTDVVTGPPRVLVAAPLLGFLPGYAVVSALFPARAYRETGRRADTGTSGSAGTRTGSTDARAERARWARGPNWVERLSLAVGTSLVALVVLAVVVSLLGLPFDTGTLTTTVVAVVVGGALLGAVRRSRLPADERLVVPVARLRAEARAGTVDARPVDAALNVALVVAVVVAASALAVGMASPDRGEAYTEVALLDDRGDDLVASNYSTDLVRGEPADLTLTVENREGSETEYTAVVVLERVRGSGGEAVVLERDELDRVSLSVPDETTAQQALSPEPTMLGDDLRLTVLVYEGDAPDRATRETAAHHLYLWVNVNASGE